MGVVHCHVWGPGRVMGSSCNLLGKPTAIWKNTSKNLGKNWGTAMTWDEKICDEWQWFAGEAIVAALCRVPQALAVSHETCRSSQRGGNWDCFLG
jgi:hypothetical protein